MAEEAGQFNTALYWTDRTQQWAESAAWPAMIAYTHVRRSMLAVSYGSDGQAAVEHAARALRTRGAPARVLAMAAKQMAFGHALAGQPYATRLALDRTGSYLGRGTGASEDPAVGQHSLPDADLLAIYTATCDVYLGGGASAVSTLQPRMTDIAAGSPRTHAITTSKLALAHANVGDPAAACTLALEVLAGTAGVESQSARSELRRVLIPLQRWPGRSDVAEVTAGLNGLHP